MKCSNYINNWKETAYNRMLHIGYISSKHTFSDFLDEFVRNYNGLCYNSHSVIDTVKFLFILKTKKSL